MRVRLGVIGVGLLLLLIPFAGTAGAHYSPRGGDAFSYVETYALNGGTGNYTGYSESTATNGSVWVTAVAANGTESASYYNLNSYHNSTGASSQWNEAGRFTFSDVTFLYVNGTDNQTGYSNPYVWFLMDNSLAAGATFYVLNSELTVVSTNTSYHLGTAAGTYVRTIFAEGNGTFQRNDVYGVFTATYNWKAYFDPSTGYVVGYVYTEQDSDGSGDGFTIMDTLAVTSATYPLAAAPPPSPSSSAGTGWLVWLVVGIVLVVVILVVIAVALRARRRAPLPTHSARGQVQFPSAGPPPPPPVGPAPPPISLTPSGQPAVQQLIIRETVKVNCRFCGNLIDSTVEKCPFCGAART
jgi:hypothetical protein